MISTAVPSSRIFPVRQHGLSARAFSASGRSSTGSDGGPPKCHDDRIKVGNRDADEEVGHSPQNTPSVMNSSQPRRVIMILHIAQTAKQLWGPSPDRSLTGTNSPHSESRSLGDTALELAELVLLRWGRTRGNPSRCLSRAVARSRSA